ncbi:MAG: hypothetical protein HXY21_12390 [Parvularculaceae bacterium]|nr:hypothetical protein [Parvularculaceae bacterium]
MRRLIIGAAALALAACATAVGTEYAAADRAGYGYASTRIEGDRFRVSFAGDGATPASVVEDYALLRAAEIALENGYDWFRVVGRSLDEREKGGVGIGAGVGGGGRNVGVGVGGNIGKVGARKFYTSNLEVLYGKGAKPEGDDRGEVYDARSVIETIRARMPAAESAQ